MTGLDSLLKIISSPAPPVIMKVKRKPLNLSLSLPSSSAGGKTVIESGYGNIFGGFTSIAWQSKGDWKLDSKAWVFSLTNKTVHKMY